MLFKLQLSLFNFSFRCRRKANCMLFYYLLNWIFGLLKTLYYLPWCTARKHLNRGPRNRHFHATLDSRENPSPSCYFLLLLGCVQVFYNSTVYLLALLHFLNISVSLVAISFWYYLWSNVAAKTKRKIGECLVASLYPVWKSKKDLAGHRKNTNSEFAEFLLYRGNSVSSPRDGNSNMKRREEMRLELDNG